MKVAIIGAGISGLSLAQLLKQRNIGFKLFEQSATVGGIAKVDKKTPVPFHYTGGHCFNSKHQEVLDFIFENILSKDQWNAVSRDARIYFKDQFISYPIEYSLREIAKGRPLYVLRVLLEILKNKILPFPITNLADYFENQFGRTLTNDYFRPYNEKIWQRRLEDLSPEWVNGKLPESSLKDILSGLLGVKENSMVHAHFYYPKEGKNAFVEALANEIPVTLNSHIRGIKYIDRKWIVGGEPFEHLVYTGPLDKIHQVIGVTESVQQAIQKLSYNRVTSSLWSCEPSQHLWSYIPNREIIFHRIVYIGKFLKKPKGDFLTLEAIGSYQKFELEEEAKKLPFVKECIAHHTSDHAYVVYDRNYREAKKAIFNEVKQNNLHLLGRFAEWEYYNMDICIKKAMDLANKLDGLN